MKCNSRMRHDRASTRDQSRPIRQSFLETKVASNVCLSILILLFATPRIAESIEPEYFSVGDHEAFVIEPPESSRIDGPMPWVFYAPTFVRRLPGPEEDWMINRFHEHGIAIVGIDVGESYGSPNGRAAYQAFYEELTSKRGYASKCVLLARSRGGLMLYNWAVEHPEYVAAVAGIYPVCNIESYPGVDKAAGAYEMTPEQLRSSLGQHNPINRLAPLAEAKVPILHIHGDRDQIVPIERNSAELANSYRRLGGPVEVEVIKGQGHNMWRGWFQSENLTEFIVSHATGAPANGNEQSFSDDPRGTAASQDFVVLKSENLEAVIGNNKSLDRNGKRHRAGYNGIFSIKSIVQPDSPFVPTYAGLNLEHYFDGRIRQEREQFFEPRYAPMKLRKLGAKTVELYQPKTSVFQVESWTRFTLAANHIDFSYRCKPHREDYVGDFLGTFWASYINGPIDKTIYFLDPAATLEQPIWQQFCTQTHNRDSTIKHVGDETRLQFNSGDALFANISSLKYSQPFFYGRFRNMVLIYMFQPNPAIRFTHSPSGGGRSAKGDGTNPAWDFQLIIPKPKAGREYELRGRLIYKEWKGRDDVLTEVSAYLDSYR